MPSIIRWTFGLALGALVVGVPFIHYRAVYAHAKRLREVTPGVLYRSGQLTAAGFTDAVRQVGIRTCINLQDEYADPDVLGGYFDTRTIKESELCRRLGVRYVYIPPDLLPGPQADGGERPTAIARFTAIMDDPANYPVLIHCRAGLHRTGVMAAVYRIVYNGWEPRRALAELKENGFGEWACSSTNKYIAQYVLTFDRRQTGISAIGGQP
jgi:protein tyrosine phosphatase (PTP) superfamily phosphohydrolase (DUF442 family)